MHELSIAEGLVALIAEQAKQHGFSRVRKIRLELGSLSAIEIDSLLFCFDVVSKESVAAGAQLEITKIPGRALCESCAHSFPLEAWELLCPACGSSSVLVQEGREMRVKDVEVDE